jgi:hypothetical protein
VVFNEGRPSSFAKERQMITDWLLVAIGLTSLTLQVISLFPPKDKKPKDKDE